MATTKQTILCENSKCFRTIAMKFDVNIDFMFYRLGTFLGTHPLKAITLSLLLCTLSAFGLLLWNEELNDVELFMPRNSPVRSAASWVEEHFQDDVRFESVIVEADNILDPSVLSAIADLEVAVRHINVSGHHWEDLCARYQSWFQDSGDEFLKGSDFEVFLEEIGQDTFPNDCIYQSLLKLWTHNGHIEPISTLKASDVLNTITKHYNDSNPKNILDDIRPLLSGVEWGANGQVKGARATILNWMLKKSDNSSPEWELEFIHQTLNSNKSFPKGMKVYAVSTRSYKDVLGQVLENNKTILFAGFSLIILYVIVMLGRCNLIEQRIWLSLLAVSVVGQSILASYGLCFYMGFFWGPLHPILPFLLLGVGIDNTYVIVQCLDNLKQRDELSIPERIGRALEQAGVSITVTSLTDTLAFAVGTSTIMPFLRSFCVFAATGILCLYFFEIFFFVSCLAIDEKRLQSKKDCCFRHHQNWKPNECSQKKIQRVIFTKYIAPNLMKTPVKVIILLTTAIVFVVNIWCVFQVEQKFDPIWYLNPDSYPIKYNNKLNEYFPQYGKRAGIYMAGINFYTEKKELGEFAARLETNPYINQETLDIWYKAFDQWLDARGYVPDDEDEYKSYLIEFLLLDSQGQAYIKDMRFNKFLSPEYNITASQIPIQHIMMNTTEEQVKAMASISEIIESYNYTETGQQIVAFSPDYVAWTANMIIGQELLRNLGLTVAAVALVTLILIQNLKTALWVNCCVIFTVVDLVGSMYWLGMTIEISTSIMVLLCAGLAVDYAAHIGHEFTRLQGTRNERAIKTVSIIGSAIFNGGLSTFLAFALLGTSDSYLFTTFFKLFTGVVVFGVFHGLLFLPVALSWFGPPEKQCFLPGKENAHSVPFKYHNGFLSIPTDAKDGKCQIPLSSQSEVGEPKKLSGTVQPTEAKDCEAETSQPTSVLVHN